MFTLTEEWLHMYYGSKDGHQESEAISWLRRWGKDVKEEDLVPWSRWKHLVEYQVNTPDIVERALNLIGASYYSELDAHLTINSLRCPVHAASYIEGLKVGRPEGNILELGTGGDSSISTSVFLWYLQSSGKELWSVDLNPLGVTWERYKDVPNWRFIRGDSVEFLNECISKNQRFGMVFIDTIHSFTHTLRELELSEQLTDTILLDDATFEGNDFDPEPGGVKRAIYEWHSMRLDFWWRFDFGGGTVVLFVRR